MTNKKSHYQFHLYRGASNSALQVYREFHPFGKKKKPNFVQVSAWLTDLSRCPKGSFFGGLPVATFIGKAPSAKWKHIGLELLQCQEASNPSVGLTNPTITTFLRDVLKGLGNYGIDVAFAYSDLRSGETGLHFEQAGMERLGYRPPSNDMIRLVWPDGQEEEIPRRTMNDVYNSSSVDDLNAGIGLKRPLPYGARAEKVIDGGKLLHATPITSEGKKWAEFKNLMLVEKSLQALPPDVLQLVARLRGEADG